MRRDPNAGSIKILAALHKYLYAGGHPVNGHDSGGRDGLVDYSLSIVQKGYDMAVDILAEDIT